MGTVPLAEVSRTRAAVYRAGTTPTLGLLDDYGTAAGIILYERFRSRKTA